MNYPTIKQLRYFIALVDNNHFGKAADSCFVSQSAFSVAIKELENVLNGRLVDRTNKSVTITNLGKETYNQAKFVMSNLTHLVQMTNDTKTPLSSKLSLGVIPTIAPFLLPKFLIDIQKEYPKLELFLKEDMTLNLYAQLMKGDLDVILIALPYELRNVEFMELFKDSFYFVSAKNSKKFKNDKNDLNNIKNEGILLLEDGHCLKDHIISACNIKSVDKISQFEASSILTLIEMVKNDLGVTFLPEMSINTKSVDKKYLDIKKMPEGNHRKIGMVWRKGSTRSKEFKLLANYIIKKNN